MVVRFLQPFGFARSFVIESHALLQASLPHVSLPLTQYVICLAVPSRRFAAPLVPFFQQCSCDQTEGGPNIDKSVVRPHGRTNHAVRLVEILSL